MVHGDDMQIEAVFFDSRQKACVNIHKTEEAGTVRFRVECLYSQQVIRCQKRQGVSGNQVRYKGAFTRILPDNAFFGKCAQNI